MNRPKKREPVDSSKTIHKILKNAAELIVETGNREVKVSDLASKAKVSRASIHVIFGKDAKIAIYRQILNELLHSALDKIQLSLKVAGPEATPIDRLVAIFRATMDAFNDEPIFGKVVLQQLNLGKAEENKIIFDIFSQVDQIIADARAKGELSNRAPKDDWKIRQILFVITRGLLRTMYFKEGHEERKHSFSEKEVEVEVLKILQLYCSKEPSDRIETIINLLSDAKRQKSTA